MAYDIAHASSIANENTGILGPGFTTLDGVLLAVGMRILLTRQTTKSQNGVWLYNGPGTALQRPPLGDQYALNNTFDNATVIWVKGGTARAGTVWGIDPAAVVTVGGNVGGTAHTLTRVSLPPVQCRCATTEHIDLSVAQPTIDGINVTGNGAAGSDIVLVKDETDPKDNGFYWANTLGPMARCTEPLVPSRAVSVSEGTACIN